MITDLAPYRTYLEGLDLTDEQALEFVNALWGIAQNIVDNHLGVNQLGFKAKEPINELDSVEANATLKRYKSIA